MKKITIAVTVLAYLLIGCRPIISETTNDLIAFQTGLSIYVVDVSDKTVKKVIGYNNGIGYHSPFWITDKKLGFLFEPDEKTIETEFPLGIYDFTTGKVEIHFNSEFPVFLLRNATRFDDTLVVFTIQSFDVNAFNIKTLEVTEIGNLYGFGLRRKGEHMRVSPNKVDIVFAGLDSTKFKDLLPLCATEGAALVRDFLDDIYLYSLQKREVRQLTNTQSCDRDPMWSPDGEKIVFSSNRNGNFEIYLMDKNGENLKQLTNNPAKDTDPEFSPDGKTIGFISNRSEKNQIWTMDIDGKNLIQITEHRIAAFGPISWSISR